jgi:subtilisin family serine protease
MPWRSGPPVLLAGLVAAAVLVVPAGGGGTPPPSPTRLEAAAAWNGLVGGARQPVDSGQRVLVVLTAFSLADRVQRAGGLASDVDERRWTSVAAAAQEQFISNLARTGVYVRPEFRYTRTVNAFSAILDPRAIALVERTPGVRGVYPVRAAYPASIGLGEVRQAVASAPRPGVRLAGIGGRGVTVALLDTGVDPNTPYLHGRVLPGIDVVGSGQDAAAQTKPTDREAVEAHGTEMAGPVGVASRHLTRSRPGRDRPPDPRRRLAARRPRWVHDLPRADQLLVVSSVRDPDGNGDARPSVSRSYRFEPFAAFSGRPVARAVLVRRG